MHAVFDIVVQLLVCMLFAARRYTERAVMRLYIVCPSASDVHAGNTVITWVGILRK